MMALVKRLWRWVLRRRAGGPAPGMNDGIHHASLRAARRSRPPPCVVCRGGWTKTRPPKPPAVVRCRVCAGTGVVPAKVRRLGLDLGYGFYFEHN
jgi:hypothetical protein